MKKIIILLILLTTLFALPSCAASKPKATASSTTHTYVLNKNTKKFHKPSCGSVNDIKPKNKKQFTGSRNRVIAMGYSPCGNCNP